MAGVHGLFGSILELGLSCLDLYLGAETNYHSFSFVPPQCSEKGKQTNKNHLPSWDGHTEGVVEMMFMMVRPDRVPEELWTEVRDIVQEAVTKHTREKNAKRQNSCLRRPYKLLRKEENLKGKEKRKDIPI